MDPETNMDVNTVIARARLEEDKRVKRQQELMDRVQMNNRACFEVLIERARKATPGTKIVLQYMAAEDLVYSVEFKRHTEHWTAYSDEPWCKELSFDDFALEGYALILLRKGTDFRVNLQTYLVPNPENDKLIPFRYIEESKDRSWRPAPAPYKQVPHKCYNCARWQRGAAGPENCTYYHECLDHDAYFYKEGEEREPEDTDNPADPENNTECVSLDDHAVSLSYGGGFDVMLELDTGVVKIGGGDWEYGVALLPEAEDQILELIRKGKEIRAQKEVKE